MNKLKILNLTVSDEGGAGYASLYLNKIFNSAGHHSILLVKQSQHQNENVFAIEKSLEIFINRVITKINKLFSKKTDEIFNRKYSFFNTDEGRQACSGKRIAKVLPFKPDIIVLHWVSNYINTKTIQELAKWTHAKIYWILMDDAALTGGCHYPWDCEGYRSDCSNCPAILKLEKKYIAKENLFLKKERLPKNIELIACSEFDYARALKSSLFKGKSIHKVLLPVDDTRYMPGDRENAKEAFGISNDKAVILYGSFSLADVRKGGEYFKRAVSIFCDKLQRKKANLDKYVVLMIGADEENGIIDLPISIIRTGRLNEEELIRAYQAADIYVSSSVEDSGPLMINQSLMCGTPVASFEMGVALDLVVTGRTGYLAKLRDSDDLAFGVNTVLELDIIQYNKMRRNSRDMGIKCCRPGNQLGRYNEIFSKSL